MASYATQADFEAYVEGWVTDDAAALGRLLERASRDVDSILGPLPTITTGTYAGLKVDPTAWQAWEAVALARATCAQALYRFNHRSAQTGEIIPRASRIKGPDFEEDYGDVATVGTGRVSPDLAAELAPIRHRRQLYGYARA